MLIRLSIQQSPRSGLRSHAAAVRCVWLPLAVLLFGCESANSPLVPSVDTEPGVHAAPLSMDQVTQMVTPPGLRLFRQHTHSRISRGPTSLAQQPYSSLALSVSQPADLGTTFGSNEGSVAMAINSSGQIAGWTTPIEGVQLTNAIFWEADGTPVELPKLTDQGQAFAGGLNDAGVVVGSASELNEQFGWQTHAVRWNSDRILLELPWIVGARNQSALAINSSGVVVGWAELVTGGAKAVRWDDQGAHVLPGNNGVAYDINDAGIMVGYVEVPGVAPAIWSPTGTLTVLSLPDGDTFGSATGINNLGQVVGTTGWSSGPELTHHAVIWAPDGTPTVIPNSEMGEATKINDAGVVVGYAENVSPDLLGQTGVIWVNGQRILAPPAPVVRTGLNDLSETHLAGVFYRDLQVRAARWSFSTSPVQFNFNGFFAPVRNPGSSAPYVVNRVKPGSAVPIKFSLGGNHGLNVLAAGNPSSKQVACTLADNTGGLPTNSVGGGLAYDPGADQYRYLWKTEKSWAGTCRQLVVGLIDGSVQTALFKFGK
jgi:uncharacterized membrane protein